MLLFRSVDSTCRAKQDPSKIDIFALLPLPQRVFQLDSLARKVVSDLQLSQADDSSLPASSSWSASTPSSPLSPLDEVRDREDLGLDHRLRIDESGKLMLGQEHLFRDLLHPLPVPGSWIWADIMLYELSCLSLSLEVPDRLLSDTDLFLKG